MKGKMSTPAIENQEISPIHLQQQLRIARNEINNLRQQLITLNNIHKKNCELINEKLEGWKCPSCKKSQNENFHLTQYSASSSTSINTSDFQSSYIGTIHTNFLEKRGTPRQPGICANVTAKITLDSKIFTNPEHALQGLEEFSHMWILFHFHRNDSTHVKAKVSPPRLNGIRTGVFSTRSPHRPCPIGLSLVKIGQIEQNVIYFSGVDMIDGTPVLDIKPYIPQYDYPGIAHLNIRENCDRNNMLIYNIGNNRTESLIDDTNNMENMSERVMDGEENGYNSYIQNIRPLENSSNSRIGEREAPDGEEEEAPTLTQPAPANATNDLSENLIRVPSWIDHASVARLTVLFKDRALTQLSQLGPDGEEKKSAITNILQEDPRSVYLRERWSSHCYIFRIAELHVSCKFNDNAHTVTVYQVFQNEGTSEEEQPSNSN